MLIYIYDIIYSICHDVTMGIAHVIEMGIKHILYWHTGNYMWHVLLRACDYLSMLGITMWVKGAPKSVNLLYQSYSNVIVMLIVYIHATNRKHSLSPINFDSGGLMQERRNSIANALELRLYCTNPLIWNHLKSTIWNRKLALDFEYWNMWH